MATSLGPQVGLDIGQQRDPTAVVVTTRRDRDRDDGRGKESEFSVRYLERLKLGTPYPEVVEYVRRLISRLNEQTEAAPWLIVDATGVGTPVADELRKRLVRERVKITEAIFVASETLEVSRSNRMSVGKMALVSRLQTLLSWRRIRLPETPMAHALADELRDFEVRPSGVNDIAGAFRTGAHDDLVVALGLATLEVRVPRVYSWKGPPGPKEAAR